MTTELKPEQYLHTPKQGKLVQVYNASHIKEVIKNEDFEITDMMKEDVYGNVAWTTIYVTLFGQKQSLFFDANQNMHYEILQGEAWFTIENKGEVVTAGDTILVYQGLAHKLYNTSRSMDVKYRFDYPGKLDLRKFLGEEKFTVA